MANTVDLDKITDETIVRENELVTNEVAAKTATESTALAAAP